MLRLDHVLYAARDLDAAADRFLDAHGLASVAGGAHAGWGTANRVVPLRDGTYVELIAVVDRAVASRTRLGRAIGDAVQAGDAWFALCLSDDELDRTAARLRLDVTEGSRRRPDGHVISWRSAGIEEPRRTADLPFFIAWNPPADAHPSTTSVSHPSGAHGIALVEISGDPDAFADWTGGARLPVTVSEGAPAMIAVTVTSPSGDRRIV